MIAVPSACATKALSSTALIAYKTSDAAKPLSRDSTPPTPPVAQTMGSTGAPGARDHGGGCKRRGGPRERPLGKRTTARTHVRTTPQSYRTTRAVADHGHLFLRRRLKTTSPTNSDGLAKKKKDKILPRENETRHTWSVNTENPASFKYVVTTRMKSGGSGRRSPRAVGSDKGRQATRRRALAAARNLGPSASATVRRAAT